MKIVVRLILSFPLALVVPFNSLTWFQSDLKAVSCSCNNIRHLQNQEKDAVRSARRAGVIVGPVLGNLIPVDRQSLFALITYKMRQWCVGGASVACR